MAGKILRIVLVGGTAFILANCVGNQNAWYEERCLKAGNAKGTAAYDACVARDQAWVESTTSKVSHTRAYSR